MMKKLNWSTAIRKIAVTAMMLAVMNFGCGYTMAMAEIQTPVIGTSGCEVTQHQDHSAGCMGANTEDELELCRVEKKLSLHALHNTKTTLYIMPQWDDVFVWEGQKNTINVPVRWRDWGSTVLVI